MTNNEKLLKLIRKYNVPVRNWENRQHLSRRHFFQLAGAGVSASFLSSIPAFAQVRMESSQVEMKNTARNVIFVLLAGAPSHVDTFDLKIVNGATPVDTFRPETINGVLMPTGLLPKMSEALGDYVIIRAMRSWALVHSLAQTWSQIGRNPIAALGDIAPNIGSVVAIEKEAERRPGQVFPTFLALNSGAGIGQGYFEAAYGPFRVNPAAGGIGNTQHPEGAARFATRTGVLNALDGALRASSPYGKPLSDFGDFYNAARGLMYNPTVDQAFRFTNDESLAYGNSAFGNSCLVAQKVLRANQGTRFIQITYGGWDHHVDIYANPNNLPRQARWLDDGLSKLIADLKASGLYDSTLLVVAGEFGRTVGSLNGTRGRDHLLQQFCLMGGAGIKGGRVLGVTNATGSASTEAGWSRQRDVRPEDIEATIYSAMGINWTTIRYDDPFGRGFEYVPYAKENIYNPVNELWG